MAVSDVLITPPVPLLHRTSLPRQNTSQTAAALALAALNFNVEQSMGASSSLASSNTPGSDSTVDSDNLDTACDREVLRSVKDGGSESLNVEERPSPKKKLRK